MSPIKSLLALMLLLPMTLSAAVRPEFAALDAMPTSGTLVIPLRAEGDLPAALPAALRGELESAISAASFKAKAGKSLKVFAAAGYDQVQLIGLGADAITATALQNFGGSAASTGAERISILWQEDSNGVSTPAAHIAFGVTLGAYAFDKYKKSSKKEDASPDPRVVIYSAAPDASSAAWLSDWSGVAEAVYFTRDLINEPANVIYPESFVTRTREAFSGLDNVSVKALDVRQMEKLGMGALLGVGMGSQRPPRLLVVSYRGGPKNQAPLAFVGKGVTFDTGGISLKNPKGMWRMKYDMSGAAAVTGTVLALAKRGAPVNAVAIAPLVENMPSQMAQRPGDIRTTMSGKTIEVLNTDAEGRLILSDAVWYAQKEFSPSVMVDVATLTGSVKVALGTTYAGLFSRQDGLANQLVLAGAESGEEVWRLPLHADFRKAIKSDIADIKNVVEGGSGGASVGAEVIGSFVEPDTQWAHLDIAGKAWGFKAEPTAPKGAVGWGVRLLNQFVMDNYEAQP